VAKLVRVLFSTTMISTSGSAGRLVAVYFMSFIFSICVLVNMLACLWYWAGATFTPGEAPLAGWMSQQYSAPLASACALRGRAGRADAAPLGDAADSVTALRARGRERRHTARRSEALRLRRAQSSTALQTRTRARRFKRA